MTDPISDDSQEESEALKKWMLRRDRLAAIALPRTLEALGADANQDRDKSKWKIPSVGNIIIKNQTWNNVNLQLAGFGSVRLVRHALNLDKDTEAMVWLAERFPEELEGEWTPHVHDEEQEEAAFRPPERFDDGLDDVRHYLVQQRGLPKALIEREIADGRLYATRKWDSTERKYGEAQCVFIGPASAEIRSTDADGFKGCCAGSDSQSSGYQVMFQGNHARTVVVAEAAVDALSRHALYPGEFAISTNGAGRFELQYKLTLEAQRNGFRTVWGMDADTAGDVAAQRVFNALYLRDVLSAQWDIAPELIDEWLITNKILAVPSHSPHELFLNDVDAADHEVHVTERDPNNPSENIVRNTGERLAATLSYKVLKACGKIKRGVSETFQLTPQEIHRVLEAYEVTRDRPVGAKDWNEVWKRQGPKAAAAYNTMVENDKNHTDEEKPTHKIDAPAPTDTVLPQTDVPVAKATGRFARTTRVV